MGDCNIHNIFHMKPLRVCINDTLIKKIVSMGIEILLKFNKTFFSSVELCQCGRNKERKPSRVMLNIALD